MRLQSRANCACTFALRYITETLGRRNFRLAYSSFVRISFIFMAPCYVEGYSNKPGGFLHAHKINIRLMIVMLLVGLVVFVVDALLGRAREQLAF